MLRIVTTLRNAFERPPEREGRELRFAKKPGDEREEMAMGEEGEEKPPEESGSEEKPKEEHIHAGEEEAESRTTRERREPIDPEKLVEKAKDILEKMKKVIDIVDDEEFQKILQAAKKHGKGKTWVADIEESRQFCEENWEYIENLKNQAEQFAAWNKRVLQPRDLAAANLMARRAMLREEPTEERRRKRENEIDEQSARINAYFAEDPAREEANTRWTELDGTAKTPMIQRLEELTDLHGSEGGDGGGTDGTLREMDRILTVYNESLDEFIANLKKKRKALEEDQEEPEDGSGRHGSFTLKLIHLVYLGMAIKKIYDIYKKQWEYDMEKASSELAIFLGKPWMGQKPFQKLIDEVEAHVRKEKEEAKSRFEGLPFSELFPGGKFQREHTEAENMAKLEVAAKRGLLYKIDEEFSTLSIYGTPLRGLVPKHWSTEMIKEYYATLQGMNRSAANTEMEKGKTEARGYLHDGFAVAQLQAAVDDGLYWKAVGIAEWIMTSRVGSGQGGAAIATTILDLMIENAQFGKLVPPEVIKNIGGLAERGIPEYSLFSLKEKMMDIKEIGKIKNPKRRLKELMELGPTQHAALDLWQKLTGPNGEALVDAAEVYDAKELGAFHSAHQKPSAKQIIRQAVGKILAGQLVKARNPNGTTRWIWAYDKKNFLLQEHRGKMAKSPFQIDIRTQLKDYDMGHFMYMNEGKMLSPEKMQVLFTYNSTNDEITANQGGERLTAFLAGIADYYNKAKERVQKEGAPEEALKEYERDLTSRLQPGIQWMIGNMRSSRRANIPHHFEVLRKSIAQQIGNIPPWLNVLLKPESYPTH